MSPSWKPSREEIAAAQGRTVPDLIAPDLKVLFCGINPSLYSAAVGHHFARPGNRFWPALHASGITRRRLSPFEGHLLLEIGCGITNVVDRATTAAAEVSAEEFEAGGRHLERKVERFRPAFVAFLGITSYRAAFDRPRATIGLQPEIIGETGLWVLPNPSGLNAHYQVAGLAGLFVEMAKAAGLPTRPDGP